MRKRRDKTNIEEDITYDAAKNDKIEHLIYVYGEVDILLFEKSVKKNPKNIKKL